MSIARSRLVGIYLVISSAVLWSTAGLFVRIADMDVWSMVAWRSAFSFVTLGAFVLIRRRWTKKGVKGTFGMPGVVACVVSTVAAITYIASLQWTTVANVMTVYATLPFVATGIAFLWLHDPVTYRFVIAGCLAFLGVVISVGAAMSANDLLGILAAFIMTAGCATQIVIAKRFPSMDSTMMTVLAALACFCIALPLMQYSIPTSTQLLACASMGFSRPALVMCFCCLALAGLVQVKPDYYPCLMSSLPNMGLDFLQRGDHATSPSGRCSRFDFCLLVSPTEP
ncbi:drug/metabolite transporter (DMT)-like permease [Rhizobium sp. BK226]|uniref:DMT family transporter n=1 Tax=Rhizobium sp. BK226 TaxID=2587075 RepID=UPI00182046C0|nr:DMT family transporter [Rhizobium sp. BK226]MBB4112732.1 drug/metabolite transporter (DMT)-like permease [Rhizobium sp. BK226]